MKKHVLSVLVAALLVGVTFAAIADDYTNAAFAVKSTAGAELLRMVNNGNVLLMTASAQLTQNTAATTLQQLAQTTQTRLIIKNSSGAPIAVLTNDAKLYLAGTVTQNSTANPSTYTNALKVLGTNGSFSLIDNSGNLLLSGYMLINGNQL